MPSIGDTNIQFKIKLLSTEDTSNKHENSQLSTTKHAKGRKLLI